MPLILYFSHIFTMNAVLEKISRKILKKNKSKFYLTVSFCLKHDNVIYRWKTYEKTNILTYNMLKSVAKCVIVIFLNILGIIKLTKIPPRP